jgi:ClpP class serine protease
MSQSRVLQYIDSSVWAITPDWLGVIRGIASRSEEITELHLEAIEKTTGRSIRETQGVTVRDGVAVVPIHGPLFRYANLFTRFSGATSAESLARDLGAAATDPLVREIVIDVDSPGGEINGIEETAKLIRAISQEKPVTALVSFLGTSGAYWLASAAPRVITVRTGVLGSIGTLLRMGDGSDEEGEIVFQSSQSPHKVIDPTTAEGAADIQTMLDSLAQVFIESVAEHRGVSVEKVMSDFGRGGVRVGDAAVEAGMADATGTLEGVIAELSGRGPRPGQIRPAASAGGHHSSRERTMPEETPSAEKKAPEITREYLESSHPRLVAAFREEGRVEGAARERERINAVFTVGYDEKGQVKASARGLETVVVAAMAKEGLTKPEVALQILDAREAKEAAAKAAKLEGLKADEEALETPTAGVHPGTEGKDRQKVVSEAMAAARKAGVIASKPSKN